MSSRSSSGTPRAGRPACTSRRCRPGRAQAAGHGLATFTGNDPYVVDFLQSEFLAGLPADERHFLTRTSMLERLSGPLCDAVLATRGSAAMLESLERSNRFVVALDRDRKWYRCHHLVRDLLIDELQRSEPDLLPDAARARLGLVRGQWTRGRGDPPRPGGW